MLVSINMVVGDLIADLVELGIKVDVVKLGINRNGVDVELAVFGVDVGLLITYISAGDPCVDVFIVVLCCKRIELGAAVSKVVPFIYVP